MCKVPQNPTEAKLLIWSRLTETFMLFNAEEQRIRGVTSNNATWLGKRKVTELRSMHKTRERDYAEHPSDWTHDVVSSF